MTKRTLLIAIPVAALLFNGVGYLIVSKMRPAKPAVSVPMAAPSVPPSPSTAPAAPTVNRAEQEKTGQERRAAGLVALEAGEYDKALIQFTEAQSLLGDKAHVADLIRVTQDLRSRPPTPATANRVRNPVSAAPAAGQRAVRTSAGHRNPSNAKEEKEVPVEPEPVAASTPSGLVIVTTVPRGLLVQVDDTPIDLTPMRTKVRPGAHRIALLDGNRKVYETTLDVKEGGTSTVLKDLSGEGVGDARQATAPTPAPAAPREEVARPQAEPVLAAREARLVTPPGPAKTVNTGTLDISSPGLYGVVWINGRPRGYPPLEVRDLPAGPTKIEIRVNGVAKRTSSVVVQAGLSTAVKLRSQLSGP